MGKCWPIEEEDEGSSAEELICSPLPTKASFVSAVAGGSGGWKRSVRNGGGEVAAPNGAFWGGSQGGAGENGTNAAGGSFVYPPSGGVCPKRSTETPKQIEPNARRKTRLASVPSSVTQ
ncbi:hypothetical protein KSP40_PGU013475 [Platanthera guangdongensis]|uniref:Uncharacterized protein n=1 Tax=Platanthera guangdongensis TaxID=2320717 RepID=A0ABR2LKZ9_9ASPA